MKFSAVIAHSRTNFSEIKSIVAGIFESLKLNFKVDKYSHNSFINGRCASTNFGFFGEINPQVLENFGLEVPVTGFEFDLTKLFHHSNELVKNSIP
jgi:phenylalanyl-tRNA synthetase beta chain